MGIRLNSVSNVANASFSNTDMMETDTECASIKWTGTVTEDTDVYLAISGSRVINNDITIPKKLMQISYSVFNTDYADITSP